jgi:hypothetical protein
MDNKNKIDNKTLIFNKINSKLNDIPKEIAVNVILKGESARKFYIIKQILLHTVPELDEDEIDKFILRSGVEREINKITDIWDNE